MGKINKLIQINESYLRFFSNDYDLMIDLYEYFSFFTDNYRWDEKYKSGIWDGKIHLFNHKNGIIPIGLYEDINKYLARRNIKFEDKTQCSTPGPNLSVQFIEKFRKKILKSDLSYRDFQTESVRQILKYKKTIILSATGSGKSYIIFLILNLLKYMNDEFKFLLVVPSTSLVEQMRKDFIEYGQNFCDYDQYIHTIYSGKEKHTDKPITISTWQSLQKMPKDFFIQFDGLIIDETHEATAKQLSDITKKCTHAIFKIGTTGSLKDNEAHLMQLKSLFSRTFTASNTKDLQKRGILSKLKIRNVILDYDDEVKKLCKKLNYADEMDLIRNLKIRKKFICNLSKKLKNENTLILFRNIDYGKQLYEQIKKTNDKTFFIYGGTKVEDREKAREIAEANTNVKIVASFGTFSRGINIKNLHHIIFAESMKSSIKVIQSIGRSLRLHKSKKYAILWDIVDNLQNGKNKNYALKHFLERVRIYDRMEQNYKTKTVKFKRDINENF